MRPPFPDPLRVPDKKEMSSSFPNQFSAVFRRDIRWTGRDTECVCPPICRPYNKRLICDLWENDYSKENLPLECEILIENINDSINEVCVNGEKCNNHSISILVKNAFHFEKAVGIIMTHHKAIRLQKATKKSKQTSCKFVKNPRTQWQWICSERRSMVGARGVES